MYPHKTARFIKRPCCDLKCSGRRFFSALFSWLPGWSVPTLDRICATRAKVPAEIRQFQSSADCQEKSFKSTYANKPVIFHDYFTFCCNTHTRSSFLHSSACYLRSHICRFLACTHAFISARLSSAHTHTCAHTRALKVKLMMSVCTVGPLGFEVC